MAASERVLGVGVIGLGGASLAMIPKFVQNPNFRVVAAADIDTEIMNRFGKDFPDAESYEDAARLCGSRNVELVYIATPYRLHAEHAMEAVRCKSGRGTRAARRCMNSSGDMTIWVVPSLTAQ